jgi:Cys-tRNA(Pro) deacylase
MEYPITLAVRVLKEKKISFDPHFYLYEEHGGTGHAARSLGVDEHAVVKTLVFETDMRKPLLVLMHGDREVSTKQLARFLGVKQVIPCDPASARRHTGYMVGGISPFGTRTPLPVYVETTILPLPTIYINGGKRGFLVSLSPASLGRALKLTEVQVGIEVA